MDAAAVEQATVGVLAVSFAAILAGTLVRQRARITGAPRGIVLGALFFGVLAALLRFAAAPALVHTNFHGAALVEAILASPDPHAHRAEYGQGSFFFLGLFAAVFGRSAETIFACNILISALTTAPLAFVAARWAGRPSAALYASAAWAASPLVARLAASEDAHVLATAFAVVALGFVELDALAPSRLSLAGAVVSTLLAVFTRQTAYPFAPFLAAMLVERHLRAPARRGGAVAVAAILMLGPTLWRALHTVGEGSNLPLFLAFKLMIEEPSLLRGMIAEHPFFALRALSILVPTLGALGAARLITRSPIRVSLAASLGVMFGLTLPFVFPSPGVSWSFRLPLYAIALIAVGVGAARVEALLERRGPVRRLATLLSAAVFAVGVAGRGFGDNRRPSAELTEYRYLRDTLDALPDRPALMSPRLREPAPSYGLIEAMARRRGLRVVSAEEGLWPGEGPLLFFEGLGCHAYSINELLSPPGAPMDEARFTRLLRAGLDPRAAYGAALVPRPTGLRPECARALAALDRGPPFARPATVVGPTIPVTDDPPMAVFDAPEIAPRVFRWPP